MSPDGVQIADEAVRAPRLTLTPPPLNGRAQVNETGMRPFLSRSPFSDCPDLHTMVCCLIRYK